MVTLVAALIKFILIMISGILAGLIGSLTGLGGGTVITPLLTLFMGVPIIFATGASLVSTIATSAGSASSYTREKIANIKVGIGLEVATTIGAIVGSSLAVLVYTQGFAGIIYVIFGFVLLFSLIPTIRRGRYEFPEKKAPDWYTKVFQLQGSYYDAKMKKKVEYSGVRWWLGEFVMFFAGIISGLLGIGSGALKVLGMDWAMNLPMKVTTTTSNFMIGITAATGSSIYWYEGFIQFFIVSATAMGVLIGSYFGAKILVRITNKNIRWIFFAILSFLGIEMVLKGFNTISLLILGSSVRLSISVVFAVVMILSLYMHNMRQEGSKRPT